MHIIQLCKCFANVQLAEKDARNNEGNFDGMDCVGYGTLHVIYIAA